MKRTLINSFMLDYLFDAQAKITCDIKFEH